MRATWWIMILLPAALGIAGPATAQAAPPEKIEGPIYYPDGENPHARRVYLGVSAGFPMILGARAEGVFLKTGGGQPALQLTVDAGVTLGFYASALVEGRLPAMPIYLGAGYQATHFMLGGASSGDVAILAEGSLHSALLALTYRSSYLRQPAFGVSLGALVTPDLDGAEVVPFLRLALVRTD